MVELFANPWDLAFTGAGANYITLGADLSASATTASFTFPSGFSLTAPSGSNFYRLIIDGEILTWTAGTVTAGATVSGQTVTRGQEGTIQNSHRAGRPVMPHWTAASLTALQTGGSGVPSHAYFSALCALMEPGAIEANQSGTFTYTVASNVTKYLLLGWSLALGGTTGRIEPRDPRNPLPLCGVTLKGKEAASTAVLLDPSLPTYTDAWTTYYNRLAAIAALKTCYVMVSAASTSYPFLPGPYGSIITSVTTMDTTWIGLGANSLAEATGLGIALHPEIGDSSGQQIRWNATMCVPVTKGVAARVTSGIASGLAALAGSVTFVNLPSTWGVMADPVHSSYVFRDDLMTATLDTTTNWNRTQSTAGNVEIDGQFAWCKVLGNGTWGANGLYTKTGYARSAQQHLVMDIYPAADATTGTPPNLVAGWFDGSGYSYSNAAHGLDFSNNGGAFAITCFENGTSRGFVGSGYSPGCIYRLRLTLQSGGGCIYEIQGGAEYPSIGGTSWTTITPGTTSSATSTLYPGATSQTALNNYIGDVRVY